MLTKMLRPPKLSINVENRAYEVGEAVDVEIEVTSAGAIRVRQGRLDLIWVERYIVTEERNSIDPRKAKWLFRDGQYSQMHMQSGFEDTVKTRLKYRDELIMPEVMGSVVFIEDARLEKGVNSFSARILIEPPPALVRADGEMSCKLAAVLDIPFGKDAKEEYAIEVAKA